METIILKDRITNAMSDEEFLWFCQENKDLRIERNSKLEIVLMSPTNAFSGKINTEILRQLSNWNFEEEKGEVFDSSTGFTLPDRSVLSPDASWVSSEKWESLSEGDQNRFAPLCPEFVIEIMSKTDHLEELQKKMKIWIANGANLAWLLDPSKKITHIYRSDGSVEKITGFDKEIKGEGLLDGFILDLSLIKL